MSGDSEQRGGRSVPGRVCIAEDDDIVRQWLARTLEHSGYEVYPAASGRGAVEILRNTRVDVLITDLWMPELNGVELIETVDAAGWQLGPNGRLPEVIVLSAHLTGASTQKLLSLGVFRTLTKPIDTEELVQVVENAMQSDRRLRLRTSAGRPAKGSASNGDASGDRALVLVADDDVGVRALLRRLLEQNGYDVVEAVDGEEAVEKALANDIDLILMDLNMPRMNGHQAVAALKRATRDCFIICTTGECSKAEVDKVIAGGAISCFRKPFDLDGLTAEVKRLDLIASHRRKLVARERARAELERQWSLAERTRNWVEAQEHRYGRRFKTVVALVAAVIVIAAIIVPVLSGWTSTAAEAAGHTARRLDEVGEAAARVEGYLQRDEARELERMRR